MVQSYQVQLYFWISLWQNDKKKHQMYFPKFSKMAQLDKYGDQVQLRNHKMQWHLIPCIITRPPITSIYAVLYFKKKWLKCNKKCVFHNTLHPLRFMELTNKILYWNKHPLLFLSIAFNITYFECKLPSNLATWCQIHSKEISSTLWLSSSLCVFGNKAVHSACCE